MDIIYEDKGIEELITEGKSKRYKKVSRTKELLDGLLAVHRIMESVPDTSFLQQFSRLHYERLRHQYSGKSSVRLANGYVERLIFREQHGGIVVELIEIDDTHYGNKK